MRLIERYILRRVCVIALAALAGFATVMLTVQLLNTMRTLITYGSAWVAMGLLASYMLPTIVILTMPFAVLFGVFRVNSEMNSDSELAVVEAAGGSPVRFARPATILAVLLALASLGLTNLVEPYANRNQHDLFAKAGADAIRLVVRSQAFREIEPKVFMRILGQKGDGDFSGVFVADQRDPDTEVIYYAKHGAITKARNADVLVLADGQIQSLNNATGAVSVITFRDYALDLLSFGPAAVSQDREPSQQPTS